MVNIDELDVEREGEFFIHAFNSQKKRFTETLLVACKEALSTGDPNVKLIEINPEEGNGRFESNTIKEILDKYAGGWRPKESKNRADDLE